MTRAVLFDVDGTLVDTNWLHVLAWTRALRELGEDPAMADVHRLVGMGADRFVRELLGHDVPGSDDAYSKHYGALRHEIRALPRAADLLREAKRRGATVVLASSSKKEDVEACRAALAADDVLDHVTSSADVEASKPAPDIFAAALEGSGASAGDALAVGDTPWDVESARRCGLDCVAVLTGGWSGRELLDSGAVAVYEDAADLLERLDESPLARLFSA